jgi:membrane-bound lytic murein transglycosylase D
VRSTRAAARHLRSLYRIHGDWALAAAAYNAGSGRISRGLERYRATDFWELAQRGDLAQETRRYVPRLYAMTIIGRDPGRFGFPPQSLDAFSFDSLHVEYSVPLQELGEMTGLESDLIAQMNPHLLSGSTPTGGYWIWVPAGAGAQAQRAYIASTARRQLDVGEYTVRWGDTLGDLAAAAGVRVAELRELNPTVDFDRLIAGSRIRVPAAAAETLAGRPFEVPEEERPRVAAVVTAADPASAPDPAPTPASAADGPADEPPPARPTLSTIGTLDEAASGATHVVSSGETLSSIAVRYRTTVAAIQRENDLTGSVIRPGQRLRIAGGGAAGEDSRAPVVEHIVEPGENLTAIARRYGTSVAAIQGENDLTGSVIRPGQRLRITGGGNGVAAPTVVEHEVEAGENLSAIARRYGTTVARLQELNDLDGSIIRPGQRLVVEGGERGENGAGGSTVEATRIEHVVEPGETLWGIARRYDSTVEQITEANELGSRPIYPGQRLAVPPASTRR